MRDLLQLVGFFGAAQALVIAILVGTIAAPRTRLFAALVGLLGLAMGIITLSHTPAGRSIPFLYPAEVAISLFASPLFYLWVVLTVRGRTRIPRTAPLHFLPLTAWLLFSAGLLLRGEGVGDDVAPIEAVMAFQMFYTGLAAWRLFAQRPAPETPPDELVLARLTLGLFSLIHLAQLVRTLSDAPVVRNIVPFTAAVVVFTLTGLAVRRSQLFEPRAVGRPKAKYEHSTLTQQVATHGLEKLRRALEEGRVFLRPDLTLGELADEIGVPRSHLSQLVNERCGKSFPELLAEHRVGEASRLLGDPSLDHLTVESIGQRAGFNSRSAFFDAFKKATGHTPAAHRKTRAGQ